MSKKALGLRATVGQDLNLKFYMRLKYEVFKTNHLIQKFYNYRPVLPARLLYNIYSNELFQNTC